MNKHSSSPIVIGCTGGSGSRVVQYIVSEAGYFMGTRLNISRDAMDVEPFLDEFINPILQHIHTVNYSLNDLPHNLVRTAVEKLRSILSGYCADIPAVTSGWGWKCPRNIYTLPLIHALYPDMRFIHLVRDGRDMSISHNQNQLIKHYESMFGMTSHYSASCDSIALWQKVNIDAAEWGKRMLNDNYILIRFEDLCADPNQSVERLMQLLGVIQDVQAFTRLIQPPHTLCRYQQLPTKQREILEHEAKLGLRYFDYK